MITMYFKYIIFNLTWYKNNLSYIRNNICLFTEDEIRMDLIINGGIEKSIIMSQGTERREKRREKKRGDRRLPFTHLDGMKIEQ